MHCNSCWCLLHDNTPRILNMMWLFNGSNTPSISLLCMNLIKFIQMIALILRLLPGQKPTTFHTLSLYEWILDLNLIFLLQMFILHHDQLKLTRINKSNKSLFSNSIIISHSDWSLIIFDNNLRLLKFLLH